MEGGTTKYAKGTKTGMQLVCNQAMKRLSDEYRARVINYLKATGKLLGPLVNLDIIRKSNTNGLQTKLFRAFRVFRS